jgi:hypothetical protein
MPPFPQYALMAWCLVKHRENFTFYLYLIALPVFLKDAEWKHSAKPD